MGHEVINGDCLVEMPKLAGRGITIDAVFADPPYGVLDEEWDDMSAQEYSAFTMQWLGQVRALNCPLVTFAGERTRRYIAPLLEMLFDNVRQLIWNKGGGGVADVGFFYCYESIYFCYPATSWEVVRPKDNAVGQLIRGTRESRGLSRGGVEIALRGKKTGLCYRWEEGACLPTRQQADDLKVLLGMNGEFEAALQKAYAERDEIKMLATRQATEWAARSQDVLNFPPVSDPRHPCEKPVPLMRALLDIPFNPQTILDPFAGSFSTGEAAVIEGRNFIGIEKSAEYCAIGEARMKRAQGIPADIPRLNRKTIDTPLFGGAL